MLTLPTVVYSFAGVEMPRLGDGYPFGIYPCADGYLGVTSSPRATGPGCAG